MEVQTTARAGRVAILACLLLAAFGAGIARAAPPAHPSFSTNPALHPDFNWQVHDYAVRCTDQPLKVNVKSPPGWRGQVRGDEARSGNFVVRRSLTAGQALVVSFYRIGNPASRTYFHLRCLPTGFPPYSFHRTAPGGPDYFVAQLNHGYAVIFNRHGVPMWWDQTARRRSTRRSTRTSTVSWTTATGPALTGGFEIHRLDGSLVREVNTVGGPITDIHDLQLLPNGNYLVGGQVIKPHVDTSATEAHRTRRDRLRNPGGDAGRPARLEVGLAGSHRARPDADDLLEPGRPTTSALRHPALELARAGGKQPPASVLPQPRCGL